MQKKNCHAIIQLGRKLACSAFHLSHEKAIKMFKKIAVAAALVAASSAVFAAEPTPFYVGADIASNKADFLEDDKFGFGVFAGYQINQSVAVEAGFHRLADTTLYGQDAKADQTSISLIGSVPLTDGFSLLGRIGYNRVEYKFAGEKDHSNNALYGIGLGYAFSPVVSARLEVQKPDTNITKLVAGVAYKF
jgi:OOP family OmpA-OmpF porin